MKQFKHFIVERDLTASADINEILLAWYLVDNDWSKVYDGRNVKKQYELKSAKTDDIEFEQQSERAWVMAEEVEKWARANGYRGNVVRTWWTARKGVLSKAVGYEVDSRKNPTDVLALFSDGQFLGLSAKSTKGKGDIGFKNPGAGTFDKILRTDLSQSYKEAQEQFAVKYDLSMSASARKKEIRADEKLIAHANSARDMMLNALRGQLLTKLSSMKQEELREFIMDECMDAKPVLPRYIKVTGHGRGPFTASISDPLANDKATTLATKPIQIQAVGNDSIGVSAGKMPILKIRFKQESQAMASSLKLSCEPWR